MNLIWILLFCLVTAETTSKSKRIRRTNDKCKREYFEACRCRWNYFHCQNPNKTKLLVWSSFEVSYRGISCKSLCEFCECIEPGTPTINASTITTSTMTMSTGVIYHDEESSALLKTLLGISAGVVMLMVTVNIVCKCRYRMHCIRGRWLTKNKDEYSIEEDQSWLQCSNETTRRRQTNMNTRLKKYSLDDVRCNFEVETYSHQHQLDSSLLNLNDQEDNVSMRCKSANFMEHMDGDIEEDNESRHDLPVNDKVPQDKIQYSYVSGAREKYRSLSIRRFTENTHQTAFGGNSSSPKLTQCKHEIYEGKDQQIVLSHKQLVKECPVSVENVDNVKISIVQPLTGRVQTQNQEYLSSSRLNWDKIFRYLAKNLTASDYKLFFNILYGSCHHLQVGGDRDTGSFIEKVETRVRRDGGDSETLMFELFNQWKQIMGSNVSTEYIEEALRERSNNLLLEKFKEFMRAPPLLPRVLERSKFQPTFHMIMKPNCGDKTLQYIPYNEMQNTCYMLPNAPQCTVLPLANEEVRNTVDLDTREFSYTAYPATEEINYTTNGPVIEEIGEHDMDLSSLTSSSSSSGPLSDRCSVLSSGEIIVKRKRMLVNRDIMIYGNEDIPNKVRKMGASMVPLEKTKTRRQRKQHKSTAMLELHEMTQSMISLMKRFLPLSVIPLEAKQYSVFLKYTIGSVTKQTGESRNTVLSLSYSAYRDTETFETNRKDSFHYIYVKDRCLMLRDEEFENLCLYAEFARRNLVREITKQNGGKYREPEALFLSYDGKPFLKKKKVVRALKKTAQEAKSLSEASPDGFPTSSSTLIPEKYDSTVRENDKDHVTPINQKMDPVTCLENTVDLTNTKMDCSFFEVVSKGSENPAPGQHFDNLKDIMDNGSIDINYEHKIPYLGDVSEKETSMACSLKENDEAVKIEDLKVQAADCTLPTVVSGATNVTLQDQIVSDTNICDMVPENAQGKRESEIMFACLSCLIQNEIHNDPKSPGTFLPIELD